MSTNPMSRFTQFHPGDHVKVIDGTFVGMRGGVVSREEARRLWETVGGERPPSVFIPGLVHVVLTIFGRAVPVCLFNDQVEAAGAE